MSNKAISLD